MEDPQLRPVVLPGNSQSLPTTVLPEGLQGRGRLKRLCLSALLRVRELPGPLDTAVCWASSVISTGGGVGGGRWRQPWRRQEGVHGSPGVGVLVCVCSLYSAHGRVHCPHGRATALPTCTRIKRFVFLSGTAGAGVWPNRWLAGYRCVWLKAGGPAS